MHTLLQSKGKRPRTGFIRQCVQCETEFYAPPSRLGAKFCTRKCAADYEIKHGTSRVVQCSFCNKDIVLAPSQIRISGNYCNQKCVADSKRLTEEERVTPRQEVGRHGKRMKNGLWSTKKADKEFSLQIRNRDNWTCFFCKKRYPEGSAGMQCSHFWGRGNSATRYDFENCDAACSGCHFRNEGNKQGLYRDLKIKQLGQSGYDALERRGRSIMRRSDAIFQYMQKIAILDAEKTARSQEIKEPAAL